MPLLQTAGLTKNYQMGQSEVCALRGTSFSVENGEFVAIMGPSGSGKSTLMNLLGCLDAPTSGSYFLEGIDVSRLSGSKLADIRNRKIGFVFQSFNLLARTTALENVELPLMYAGVGGRERRRRAQTALKLVGLQGRENHLPTQLSGGQQQRVAIARALINQPVLLLADEPTGALDSATTVEIMSMLVQLNAQGLTVVVITHDHDVATYARRIVHFRDGQIVSDAVRPREVA